MCPRVRYRSEPTAEDLESLERLADRRVELERLAEFESFAVRGNGNGNGSAGG